ncbi:MAG TPA: hypothetical protein VIY49_09500 [Bryobacteraceae bacterium]
MLNSRSLDRRLRRLEQVKAAVAEGNFPDPLEVLTVEERAALRPYLEARIRGDASDYEWPAKTHRMMGRYLAAGIQRDRAMREAGIPMPSLAEILRAGRGDHDPEKMHALCEARLTQLAERFDAIEKHER